MSPPPDHLLPLIHRLRTAPLEDPPPPWHRRAAHAVGGLTDVGFGRSLVLATSSDVTIFSRG